MRVYCLPAKKIRDGAVACHEDTSSLYIIAILRLWAVLIDIWVRYVRVLLQLSVSHNLRMIWMNNPTSVV
jgi:hypothetical protein